jgi:hypothetical protein
MRCVLEREDRNETADFLNTLRLENRVTFKAIYACEREHRDEIQSMDTIFRLESEEDMRRCLAIPQILDPENADTLVDYFCSKHRDNQFISAAKSHPAGYKVLLLTAFIFNPSFFAMAWNWCSLYRHEVRMQMLREQEARKGFAAVRETPRPGVIYLGKPNMREAASGTRVSYSGHWTINQDNMQGELWMADREGGVEFIFKFAEYADAPPYYISVQGSGQQEPIHLNRIKMNRPGELSITSGKISWNDLNADISISRGDSNNA